MINYNLIAIANRSAKTWDMNSKLKPRGIYENWGQKTGDRVVSRNDQRIDRLPSNLKPQYVSICSYSFDGVSFRVEAIQGAFCYVWLLLAMDGLPLATLTYFLEPGNYVDIKHSANVLSRHLVVCRAYWEATMPLVHCVRWTCVMINICELPSWSFVEPSQPCRFQCLPCSFRVFEACKPNLILRTG
jgi:hypothetical protein